MSDATERVTVTLPGSLVREIESFEANRSRFILQAVKRELRRRRQEKLRASLREPHPETFEFAESPLLDWSETLPDEDPSSLVDLKAGKKIQWVPGRGWKELKR